MEQMNLLNDLLPNSGLPPELVDYRPGVFSADESERLMDKLISEVHWEP